MAESKSEVLLIREICVEIFYIVAERKSKVLLILENSAEIFYTGE